MDLSSTENKWAQMLQMLSQEYLPPLVVFGSELPSSSPVFYRFVNSESRLVRSILSSAGFKETSSHDWNVLWSNSTAKLYIYEDLNQFQRINHFPHTKDLCRKDRLCKTISKMQAVYGEAYSFIPPTYVLPQMSAKFSQDFYDNKGLWIVKPSCSSRGRGIFLIESLDEVPERCVVSKYIENPFLINGLKFDLRIYVLVTSYEPLKIYMYKEGLVRFASEIYSTEAIKNRFSHLTNYSVNKKNNKYVQNCDWKEDDFGHKWSLTALMRYLEGIGASSAELLVKIHDLIVKSVISVEAKVTNSLKKMRIHRDNCFEVLGFDILVDSNLNPWLLEVNLSPSLATESPLDLHTKENLLKDTFNLIGIRAYSHRTSNVRHKSLSRIGRARTKSTPAVKNTEKFKTVLRDTIEEYFRRGNYERLYPSEHSDEYDKFFKDQKIINKSIHSALFRNEKIFAKQDNFHRSVQTGPLGGHCFRTYTDNLLIEYISRVLNALEKKDTQDNKWIEMIHNFSRHSDWNLDLEDGLAPIDMLNKRLVELKNKHVQRHTGKNTPLRSVEAFNKFSDRKLEDMLVGSNSQTVIHSIVGVLTSIADDQS